MANVADWQEPAYKVLPPKLMRQPGRPKGNRRLEEDEYPRVVKRRKCSTCGNVGHNKTSCKGGEVGSNKGARGRRGRGGRGRNRGGRSGGGRGDNMPQVEVVGNLPQAEVDANILQVGDVGNHAQSPTTRGRGRRRRARATDSPSQLRGFPHSLEPPRIVVANEGGSQRNITTAHRFGEGTSNVFMRPPTLPITQTMRPPWRVLGTTGVPSGSRGKEQVPSGSMGSIAAGRGGISLGKVGIAAGRGDFTTTIGDNTFGIAPGRDGVIGGSTFGITRSNIGGIIGGNRSGIAANVTSSNIDGIRGGIIGGRGGRSSQDASSSFGDTSSHGVSNSKGGIGRGAMVCKWF